MHIHMCNYNIFNSDCHLIKLDFSCVNLICVRKHVAQQTATKKKKKNQMANNVAWVKTFIEMKKVK